MTIADHILLLAGTFEARQLAERLTESFPAARVTVSFAGVVKDLPDLGVPTRTGGFGGAEGLTRFLESENVTLVVDATHPFAAQMSRNAVEACAAVRCPLIRLERPAWYATSGDKWLHATSIEDAVTRLPSASRAFLALGRKEISRFYQREDIYGLARMIEPPLHPLPAHWDLVLSRPPQSVEAEIALFRAHDISILVTKNSGGERAYAKIEAARRLVLPVIVIDRPVLPDATTAADIPDLLEQIRGLLVT